MSPYPKPAKRPHNLCRSCGQDFNSIDLFERHRVGTHEYTYSQGARMDPPREDGRSCLSIEEMHERGWALNERGYWIDPERVEAARAAFRGKAEMPLRRGQSAAEALGASDGAPGGEAA